MIKVMIRRQFIFRPYLLSSVSKPFDGIKHAYELFRLAGEYLPEKQKELFDLTPTDAAKRFIKAFGEHYFPLTISDGDEFSYDSNTMRQIRHGLAERLPRNIPVKFLGMDRYQYEPAYLRNHMPMSQLLAETLCVCPYTYKGTRGADDRLAVVEEFKTVLLKTNALPLLELIPERGFLLEDVVRVLEGSEWPGLAVKAQWIFHKTGCSWLDRRNDDAGRAYVWKKENVHRLAKEWQKYLVMKKQMDEFESWLGQTPAARCGEVIRYISDRRAGKGKPLTEVFNGREN